MRHATLTAVLGVLGALSQHRALAAYRSVPPLVTLPLRDGPLVSIIVPARDENENLQVLLPSLSRLGYQSRELIVVDDDSKDGTAEVATAWGARVVRTGGPPSPGWVGKPWACYQGALAARGEWLLFVDADTIHSPDSLGAAMAVAQERGLGALSLLPDQVCVGFWEKVLLPFAYAGYFAGVDGATINRGPDDALLNGQYILISRAAYDAIGGHRAVAGSLVEDVALGIALARAGCHVQLLRARGQVQVRMYRSLVTVFAGFAKNAFGFTSLQPWRGALVAGTTTLAAGASWPALLMVGRSVVHAVRGTDESQAKSQRMSARSGIVAWLAFALAASAQTRWARAFGVPPWYGLLQPLAGLVFLVIALFSMLSSAFRLPIRWKGRSYPFHKKLAPRVPRANLRGLAFAMVTGRPRSFAADCAAMVNALPRPPEIAGLSHVPMAGPVCIVANHYQRPGLWIGWAGATIGFALWRLRGADPPVRFAVIADMRRTTFGRRWRVPGTSWVFRRVAASWGMVTMPTDPSDKLGRALALKHLNELIAAGEVVVVFPEGEQGRAGTLGPALPGVGRWLRQLVRDGVCVVPVGVAERTDTIALAFGAPLTPEQAAHPMQAISSLCASLVADEDDRREKPC